MKLIITEKPSVAALAARVVNAQKASGGEYYEGNGWCVTWALGHILRQCTPLAAYGQKWTRERLPILPESFDHTPTDNHGKPVPDYVKRLKVIKSLIDRCDILYNFGDAGREGEVIQREIYDWCGCKKPVRRIWISDLTYESIRAGITNAQPSELFDNLYKAGVARSEADWLVGINSTMALSVAAGKGVLSLGRVQTPTLAMICSRYIENKDFKPEKYQVLTVRTEKDGVEFIAKGKDKFFSPDAARTVLDTVKKESVLKVTSFEVKDGQRKPPLLFDLTALQAQANRKWGYPASMTLEIAQKLYMSQYITYPRTNSRYITEAEFRTLVPELIKKMYGHPLYGTYASAMDLSHLSSYAVNNSKVDDHSAFLITKKTPDLTELQETERNIYNLIASRMLEAFSPAAKIKSTSAEFTCASVTLAASGVVLLSPGWKAVLGEKEKGEEDDTQTLPLLADGETLPVIEAVLKDGETKPKPIHTEASLLEAMRTAGKEIDDEDLKSALKDCGLGTAATRAETIETIKKRNYVSVEKGRLIPTSLGLEVYNIVKEKSISNVEMTGRWENILGMIADGKVNSVTFSQKIREYTVRLTQELLDVSTEGLKNASDNNALVCPRCGKEIHLWKTNAKCQSCNLVIFRTIGKEPNRKILQDNVMKAIITKGVSPLIHGLKSKEGKSFDAKLKLKLPEEGDIASLLFLFDNGKKENHKRRK